MSLDAIDISKNPAINSLRREDAKVSGADQAAKKLGEDFDNFMLLLTTQLQNQDPTEPLDTNQFTQQLATLTSVEQQVSTNKNLEKLISMTQNSQVNSAVGFIGKSIETEGVEVFLDKGKAEMSYTVPAGAAKVTLAVLDVNGKAVFTTDAPTNAGRQVYHWDGINSFTGEASQDGIYTFGVVARNAAGEVLDTQTFASGKVTGVSLGEDDLMLTVGGLIDVPMSKVLSVREAAEAITAASTSDDEQSTETN